MQSGDWPSGVYAARLETEDGRIGFAPFVLRPEGAGGERVAVVLPTNTWQAYNLYDADGDGWGDTWYAGGMPPVRLDRPYPRPRRPAALPPLRLPVRPLAREDRREPDFYADDDLEAFPSGDDLRRDYDLVVFPGHSEYMTTRAYDIVERYRDLGGRLVFLSANNFFWKVDKRGQEMRRDRAVADAVAPGGAALRRAVPGERRRHAARRRSTSPTRTRRRGCSRAPSSRTAARSARRSAASGSRST